MNIGNKFRRALERSDALALMAMAAIREERKTRMGDPDKPNPRNVYLLRSLKTPEEVETLRKVYGDNFLIVAAYAPRKQPQDRLAEKIAIPNILTKADEKKAEELIDRDEKERGQQYGQNLREALWMADVFLNAGSEEGLNRSARRFIEILFGHPFRTPTQDESGMFQAHGAGLRSSSAGRQVGAAITKANGDLLAVGTNEVPKAFGGQYSEEDAGKTRGDVRRPTGAITNAVRTPMRQ